ncbi:hypothetical protein [Lacrimispora amygdalina]|uniref:hypothetical protein n=1 Tax=Lacrimispora amygdalina TaxID=253257 RepID=UPI000BE2F80E|nr:hypothetical protein [Lacrimispora amygdalina]
MNIKKELNKQRARAMKQRQRQYLYANIHKAENMIKKMDQQIPLIREYNQKNPKDLQLVPCSKIHKIVV